MIARITNAINNKKIEVAQSIFRDSEEVEDMEQERCCYRRRYRRGRI